MEMEAQNIHPGSMHHSVGVGRDSPAASILMELEEQISVAEALYTELRNKLNPVLTQTEEPKLGTPERVSVTAYDAQVIRLRRLNDSIRELIEVVRV